ncbi:hypothetical protein [Oxalobacter paraformigenes]|uniref:Transmembrane protein n=1 Tax=Oxalobacter paraformigenes TaxID=556268 RepID=C3X4K4_9BURK|nr:hypothetical protein [Oxalobacter paraformigenes]EEO28140.1 hypothetical protein OFAG_01293 [Oxalobacter paraformigenes]
MTTILILIASALIFAWGWHRLYAYNIRKGSRKMVAHLLGFLLGMFPAQFFLYACFVTFPPPEMNTPSTAAVVALWVIFSITVAMLFYLTTRPIPTEDNKGMALQNKKPKI